MKLIISETEAQVCPYCQGNELRRLNQKKETEKEEYLAYCICVRCGAKLPHMDGVPCRENDCPDCGKKMMREEVTITNYTFQRKEK